ncbi:hypothetical protein Dimus_012815, partial [Dionaea muscipula]
MVSTESGHRSHGENDALSARGSCWPHSTGRMSFCSHRSPLAAAAAALQFRWPRGAWLPASSSGRAGCRCPPALLVAKPDRWPQPPLAYTWCSPAARMKV